MPCPAAGLQQLHGGTSRELRDSAVESLSRHRCDGVALQGSLRQRYQSRRCRGTLRRTERLLPKIRRLRGPNARSLGSVRLSVLRHENRNLRPTVRPLRPRISLRDRNSEQLSGFWSLRVTVPRRLGLRSSLHQAWTASFDGKAPVPSDPFPLRRRSRAKPAV